MTNKMKLTVAGIVAGLGVIELIRKENHSELTQNAINCTHSKLVDVQNMLSHQRYELTRLKNKPEPFQSEYFIAVCEQRIYELMKEESELETELDRLRGELNRTFV